MKFSIVLAVAALSAETLACANIGQACKKGDPDVCQCGAPLTLSCRGDPLPRPGGTRRFHYQLGDICPIIRRNGRCVNGKCVPGPRLTVVNPTPTPE
ncbi:uncharacterized protein FFB20_03842 [Fusarium fujikuroi]|uniref:Uncharacterized protein n=1 Tax=Fusarium fujikuroi TaxID=5127 RepID=A0A2H3S719_FUSFU|nr:uncharacterized protein FFE2_01853 [Fusarium fujikuroi]SCN70691.1 uncharacterized protein FFB20_03842 [Fusarium fujikuroi]SCO13890.1 uncharacterized protein FFM5_10682 [Fusarium fujikuroi]SCO15446.1 uncharacterized protein FFC1_12482 [Fusarium fujikuroi]SCO50836.1 uncharacterized protein FFNC_13412 [Fusarium fujikuroi]